MKYIKDVKALGFGAIPRVAYEGSKRVGAHRYLFSKVKSSSSIQSVGSYFIPEHQSSAAQSCLTDSHEILTEGLLVFGRRIPINRPEDWVTDPESGDLWPQVSWWNIDIRSDQRMGDVKWTWELGRHRDLVVLARAAALEPQNKKWVDELDNLLKWWLFANPLEQSIHWYSNLELSLRLFSWDQILWLVGNRLPKNTVAELGVHIAQMRRHLWRDLPYTLSSMRNNHMLGDSIGLDLAERMTSHSNNGPRQVIARRMWSSQLNRQVNPDGSMIEDSVSYHRFVLEMLCAKVIIGDTNPRLINAIRSSSYYLLNLGALEGSIPQFGDWDEGRFLASSNNPLDVGNSVALGLALSGETVEASWIDRYDLLSWYTKPAGQATEIQDSLPNTKKVGEFAIAKKGPWQAWLKCGSQSSHGHADLGHLSLKFNGNWFLSDPGTGTYNGPLHVRNGFRTSLGHNGLRPLGQEQIEPHRAFRWMSKPFGLAGRVFEFDHATVLWGAHNAFSVNESSTWPWRLARTVILSETGVAIIDWREDDSNPYFELSVPLSMNCVGSVKDVNFHGDRLPIELPGRSRVALAETEPFLGWESPTYGTWAPAPWLLTSASDKGPVKWTIGDAQVTTEDDSVLVENLRMSISWENQAVILTIEFGDETLVDRLKIEGRS